MADRGSNSGPISEWFRGRSVLVTGATGFMGKVLVEKLLRSCPDIATIYLLMRPKRGNDIRMRLDELLNTTIFDWLRKERPEALNKLVPVYGDMTLHELGISQADQKILTDSVSVVFHSAATVKFDEALKLSVAMNILGTKRVVQLCHKMLKLQALVHVSTAYCNCNRQEVSELVYPPPADPEKIMQCVEWLEDDLLEGITHKIIGNRPNTYTFTKALAEHVLVEQSGNLPVAIVRPSIGILLRYFVSDFEMVPVAPIITGITFVFTFNMHCIYVAYFDNDNWVRYFLHPGHLTISGCKMSKSLKNFITIKDALTRHTARQLRLAFLLHSWKDTLDYSNNTMEMAVQWEKLLNEFFLTVKDVTRYTSNRREISFYQKWEEDELELNNKFNAAKGSVHASLCDSVDTRGALDAIRDLVGNCNIYIRDKRASKRESNCLLLRDIAAYIAWLLRVFGVIPTEEYIGFPVADSEGATNTEEVIMPYLSVLADFRNNVRSHARELKASKILGECDKLRDDILPNVGVRLEDHDDYTSAVKLVSRESLLHEKEAKKIAEAAKAVEKECKKAQQAAILAQRDAQRKIKPWEMFLSETDKYSKFDDKGIPTHDAEGKELSKGQIKKLQKLQQNQEKKYSE